MTPLRYTVTKVHDTERLEELETGDLFVEPWRVDYHGGSIDFHVRRKLDDFTAESMLGTKVEVYPSLLVCRVQVAEKKAYDSHADW